MTDSTYLILFSANLAFIVTHLYGWLLKWFYHPQAYREHFHELFPAQRAVGVIYLLQIFELPYLLQIGNPDALFYVNTFSLLFFSIQMLIMCEGYFFGHTHHKPLFYWLFFAPVLLLVPLFLQAVRLLRLPMGWHPWMVAAISIAFAGYLCLSIQMALKITRAIRKADEERYGDSDDFPVRFAKLIKWVPTSILVLLAINFYFNNVWVKFARDLLFIVANVGFCILTLNPWRKVAYNTPEPAEEPDKAAASHRLADLRFDDLAQRLNQLIDQEHIYTEQHITSDLFIARLNTNATYLSEVIRRCGYQSFYDMVCQHRVRHAISLIHQHPDEKLQDIADRCGFSSPASMAKAFKSQGKETPSYYRHN